MPIFCNKSKRYFVITSLKVLYTTLLAQRKLTYMAFLPDEFNLKLLCHMLRHVNWPIYMLYRNPYDRVASLFADKFIKFPEKVCAGVEEWQNVQRVVYKYIGVTEHDEHTKSSKILEAFKAWNINAFVKLLPDFFYLDAHYYPQNFYGLARISRSLKVKCPFVKIYRIEDELDRMSRETGLDFNVRENASKSSDYKRKFSRDSIETINSLYHKDFMLGGYAKLSATLVKQKISKEIR